MTRSTRPQPVLFAAAAVWSTAAIPLWLVIRQLGLPIGSARVAAADWHGFEMLFGYALAVVGGFLIGPVPRPAVVALAAAFVVARGSALVAPFGLLHAAASTVFGAAVALAASPKLFRGPSKLQNRVFGPIVILLCASVGAAAFSETMRSKLFWVGLDLYLVLLVFMGGRLIAAAAAGQYYRRGSRLDERVQPRLELGVLSSLLLLAAADLLSAPELVSAGLAALAATLLLVRWLRWRLWTCLSAWNLAALGAGYLWLPLGLALRASRSLSLWSLPSDALHGLTAGALGSLTLLVMGRTRAMKHGVEPERSGALLAAGVLVQVAAVLRVLGGLAPLDARAWLLLVSGTLWATAFAALAGFFVSLAVGRGSARATRGGHGPTARRASRSRSEAPSQDASSRPRRTPARGGTRPVEQAREPGVELPEPEPHTS